MEREDNDLLDLDQVTDTSTESSQNHSLCLVGKLHTEKSANSFAIMDVMKKAWRAKKGLDAREWTNNLFLFRFQDPAEMVWVLKNQPWHFEGHLFTIRQLKPKEQPSQIQISEADLWLRIYDAPVSCMTTSYARAMANKIGRLAALDPSLDFFGKFIRVKVAVDITKPLKRGLAVRVGGKQLWLPLKYEALPLFCFNCGMIGHSFKACDSLDHLEEQDPHDLPFGTDIKASPLKKSRTMNTKSDSPLSHQSAPNHRPPHKSNLPSPVSQTSQSSSLQTKNSKLHKTPATLSSCIPPIRSPTHVKKSLALSPEDSPLMELDCPTPIPLILIPFTPTVNKTSTPPSESSSRHLLTPKTKSKQQWKRLARSKNLDNPPSGNSAERGKRATLDDMLANIDETPEAKRLKFLSLSIDDAPTAEAASEQPRRIK